MSRVFEAVTRLMLREHRLQAFERTVSKGEAETIEVFLKAGTEYVMRGRVLGGRGMPLLSLGDADGRAVPTQSADDNGSISVVPEKDGLYHVRAAVESTDGLGSAAMAITLSSTAPLARYVTHIGRAMSTVEETVEGLPEKEAHGVKGCAPARTA